MKKCLGILLCVVLMIGLCACSSKGSEVIIKSIESDKYSQKEINSAIDVIKDEFLLNWKGCTLKAIYYAGDDITEEHQDWADRNSADEVIVLLSSFDVDSSGGDGSLDPNTNYANWKWILVRTNGGTWEHVDHGF